MTIFKTPFAVFRSAVMYAVDTFENNMSYIGNTYKATEGLPDDDYGRYLRLLAGLHYQPIQKIRLALMLAAEPSRTNLLQGLQQPGTNDPAVVKKWLDNLSKDLSVRSLSSLKISSATSESRKGELKYLGVLPFTDLHVVTVHVSVRGSDVPFEFVVGIVDGNYQIHGLPN